MSAVIERYKGLIDHFGARVEATPDDRWDAVAPCEGWTARDVVLHIVESQRRLAGGIEGREVEPLPDGVDPKEAWRASSSAVVEALHRPEALDRQVESPMGPMAVEMVVGRLASLDILVHTWDLARATGGDERLDQDAVAHAYEGIKPLDPMIRRPGVFGPRVEAPEGADLQTEFLCFLGRAV